MNRNYLSDAVTLFIILYAIAASITVFILGMSGFSRAPFINGIVYLLFASISIFFWAKFNFKLKYSFIGFCGILYLFILFFSLTIGVFNGNDNSYIVAWVVYFLWNFIFYLIYRSIGYYSDFKDSNNFFELKGNRKFILIFLVFLSMLASGQLIQYPLAISISIYLIIIKNNKKLNLIGFILIILMLFKLVGTNFSFSLSRAALLTILTSVFLSLLYKKKYGRIFIANIFVIFSLISLLIVDVSTIDKLPTRNLREGAMLIRGDNVDNYTATAQRFYEAEQVINDYDKNANLFGYLFGLGLGRTIDMTSSNDSSVLGNSLKGGEKVNNIHILPFAILHKFGLIGLAFFSFLLLLLIYSFILDIFFRREKNDILFFCYMYLFSAIVYGFFASNHLIANPLFPAILGYFISIRRKQSVETKKLEVGKDG